MHIGEQIRKLRKQQGLTVKQLSQLSGVLEKTIYRIETDKVSDPKISNFKQIIEALGISFDELFTKKTLKYKLIIKVEVY